MPQHPADECRPRKHRRCSRFVHQGRLLRPRAEQPLQHDRLTAAQPAQRRVHDDRIVAVSLEHVDGGRFARAGRKHADRGRELLVHGPVRVIHTASIRLPALDALPRAASARRSEWRTHEHRASDPAARPPPSQVGSHQARRASTAREVASASRGLQSPASPDPERPARPRVRRAAAARYLAASRSGATAPRRAVRWSACAKGLILSRFVVSCMTR